MFYMATTLCIYTNSREKIDASISESWTQTDYALKVWFSVTVEKDLYIYMLKQKTLFSSRCTFAFTQFKVISQNSFQKGLF